MPTIDIKYSYKDVPTLKKFSESNAFIRAAMGPFGCLPAEAEFLTPSGWKRIDEYHQNDLVAQWDKNCNDIDFVVPIDYIKERNSEFILFDKKNFSMALTEEHRVPFTERDEFGVMTAGAIADALQERSSRRWKLITTFAGPGYSGLKLSDDMIRFAVMMHADGHYPKAGGKATITVRKDRKKERIANLLSKLNVNYSVTRHSSRPTEVYFSFHPPYTGKHFEGDWWKASQQQLSIVLEEMIHWDGCSSNKERIFTTTHQIDADYIQYAAHANGLRASIHSFKSSIEGRQHHAASIFVRVRTGDNAKNKVALRSDGTQVKRIPSKDGYKYCFRVPSTFFVARYDGSVFVTGNSGKSSACVIEIIRRALAQKPGQDGVRRSRWAVVRNSYPQLRDTTIKTFHQWLPPNHFGDWRASDHNYIIKAFENAYIEIMFRALDRPDQIGNLLSLELTGAWVNEAREVPWSIINALEGRVGRFPAMRDGGPTWHGIILDTNPPDSDSKFYRFFEETDQDPSHAVLFKQPSGISPTAENLTNLIPNYYQNLAKGKDDEWRKVYIEGQYGFVIDGKPCFPMYHDSTHCQEFSIYKSNSIYRGWDFGLTPACCFAQLSPDGQFLLFDELVTEDMGVDQFSDEVITHSSIHFPDAEFIDIGDPAGEQRAQTDQRTCFQILRAKGIEIIGGLQSLAIRLESMRKPMMQIYKGKPGLLIHPRCKTLRKAFQGGYNFRRLQTSEERYTSIPNKNHYSHIADSAMYLSAEIFGRGLTIKKTDPAAEDDYRQEFMYEPGYAQRSEVTGY